MSFAMATSRSPASRVCEATLMPSALLDEDVGSRLLDQRFLLVGEFPEPLLPRRGLSDPGDLDRGHLVLGAVGGPVRVLRRNDVGTRFREVERAVHNTRLDAIGHARAHHTFARAAGDAA